MWWRQLIFIGLSILISWITSPLFFGVCGARNNPSLCIIIRGAIFFGAWFLLNLFIKSKKTKST